MIRRWGEKGELGCLVRADFGAGFSSTVVEDFPFRLTCPCTTTRFGPERAQALT